MWKWVRFAFGLVLSTVLAITSLVYGIENRHIAGMIIGLGLLYVAGIFWWALIGVVRKSIP